MDEMTDQEMMELITKVANEDYLKKRFCKNKRELQAFEMGKNLGEVLTWNKAIKKLDNQLPESRNGKR